MYDTGHIHVLGTNQIPSLRFNCHSYIHLREQVSILKRSRQVTPTVPSTRARPIPSSLIVNDCSLSSPETLTVLLQLMKNCMLVRKLLEGLLLMLHNNDNATVHLQKINASAGLLFLDFPNQPVNTLPHILLKMAIPLEGQIHIRKKRKRLAKALPPPNKPLH